MMVLNEFVFAVIVLVLAFVASPRVRYWTKMIIYFGLMQIVTLVLLPVALFNPKDPQNFVRAAQLLQWSNWIFGITWKIKGTENIKDKAYIIVANHQSSLDALGMVMTWKMFHPVVPVMKAELKYAFSFGLYCSLSGTVFVDRGTEKGRKALEKGLEEAKKVKKSMWIFPEGTRNHTDGKLLPFKKGAFHMAIQAKIPILPVVFSDYSTFYDRDEQRFDSGTASITILPEISTDDLTTADVTDLSERTRNLMMDHYA